MRPGPSRTRRKALLVFLMVAAAPAFAMAVAAVKHASGTRSFWIDGKGFRVSRNGADDPENAIREIPDGAPGRIPCPDGLDAVHTMKLERDDATVSFAVGRRASRGDSLRKTLTDQRWEPRGQGTDTSIPRVYVKKDDKENAIVFVDENTGDCLLFRQGGK